MHVRAAGGRLKVDSYSVAETMADFLPLGQVGECRTQMQNRSLRGGSFGRVRGHRAPQARVLVDSVRSIFGGSWKNGPRERFREHRGPNRESPYVRRGTAAYTDRYPQGKTREYVKSLWTAVCRSDPAEIYPRGAVSFFYVVTLRQAVPVVRPRLTTWWFAGRCCRYGTLQQFEIRPTDAP